MKRLLFKRLKYSYFLFIFITIFSGFFIGNVVIAQSTSNIEYEFQNGYAYNGVLPETTILGNQRNATETTGIYNATYSFENEIGLEGLDIPFVSVISIYHDNNIIEVSSELYGHYAILKCSDNNLTGYSDFFNSFDITKDGIIEFWFLTSNITTTYGVSLRFQETSNIIVDMSIDSNDLKTSSVGGILKSNCLIVNQWNHVKFEFNDVANTFDFYFNGILEKDDLAYVNPSIIGINRFQLSTGTNDLIDFYLDAIGYSWDINYTNYYINDLDLTYGTYSGNLIDVINDDSNYVEIQSEVYGEGQSMKANFLFDGIELDNSDIYLSYHIESLHQNIELRKNDGGLTIDYGISIIDKDLIYCEGINSIQLTMGNMSYFTVNLFYFKLSIGFPNYIIGDNLLYISIPLNITEVDKFEFTYDNTGSFNQNDDDNVNGFSDIENDYWSNDVVNIYDSIDDNVDKCIQILSAQLGNCGIERDFDVDVNISEVWWQIDLISLGYPKGIIYTRIENKEGEPIAFFKLEGWYYPYGANHGHMDLYFNIADNWEPVLITNIPSGNIANLTFRFTWNQINEFGVLTFNDINYPIYIHYDVERDSLGKVQIYAISDNYIVYHTINIEIDWIRILVNGSSISDEVMPENVFVLTGQFVNLLYQSFIEITFDITFDNNVSIYLNDDIQLIDYTYNATANRVFFVNVFQTMSYKGLFLRIYNSTSFNIENIKIYGVQLVNQQDIKDNPFLLFSYSNVNPNISYFYVIGNDLHYHFETTNNSGLEYIQATFNINDLSCEGYAIAFTHRKDFTYLESECKVVFTSDTYLSFISMNVTKSISVILPQDKIIKEIVFLITDNDNQIIDISEGYFSDIVFMYYQDISITITTLSLFDVLPIVVLVVIIPIALYFGFGKKKELLVPSIIGMSIFGTVIGIIPLWLLFVILFGGISYYLIKKAKGD